MRRYIIENNVPPPPRDHVEYVEMCKTIKKKRGKSFGGTTTMKYEKNWSILRAEKRSEEHTTLAKTG